jgi:hypothetical protein
MTPEEELICHPVNRDLFVAWHEGAITLEEAVRIVRRCDSDLARERAGARRVVLRGATLDFTIRRAREHV